jgi:hypothetical protein
MRAFFVSAVCSAIVGVMALSSPAYAKTAKECQTEWRANKAANQKAGITEKAYVEKCRGEAGAAKSKTKEKAVKEKPAKKKAAAEKKPAAAGAKQKTVKACEDEWRANKAANQKAGITQKAYVEKCRAGETVAAPKAMPAAPAPAKEKASAPMAPKKTAAPAPATGKPSGANQYAAESQAKARCPRDTVVWANLDSKIYHFAGRDDYGHTKIGAYMCEKDAMSQGMRAAKNEKHP